MATVSEGVQAPDFEVPTAGGAAFRLSAQRGRANLALVFLDRAAGNDDQRMAEALRDASELFKAERTTVVAAAKASVAELRAFREAHALGFELLSDEAGTAAAAYGARARQGFGPFSREKFVRSTFLLDRTGVVRRIFRDPDLRDHVNEILGALDVGL